MRRNWIKLYVDQILRGTMFKEMENPAERFVWFGFLLLTGDSPFDGKIAITDEIGYTDEQLGSLLMCHPEVVKEAKEKMLKYDKIKVEKNNVILIVNWAKYQSEYERLKVYKSRGKKGTKKSTQRSTKKDTISSLSISPSISLSIFNKEKVINMWNDFAKNNDLSSVIDIPKRSTRERSLKARMGNENFNFSELLEKIKKQPFLLGENDKGWRVTFDWILGSSNYTKIMEEQYKDRSQKFGSDDWAKERTKKSEAI